MGIFNTADILLPKNADLEKWSVVACDQYTSEPEYWHKVEEIVGGSPSTLKLVYPEVYLEESGSRTEKINSEMASYLENGIFREYPNSLIYLERDFGNGKIRRGIVGSIDLEAYDYAKGSHSQIRATEGTVLERIPPRVKIRENALLELPHVMLLLDDGEKTVIESISPERDTLETVYDFELMMNGGHLCGYLLKPEKAAEITDKLGSLSDEDTFMKKYGRADAFLLAVGDGNHSLATAKACWESLKPTLSPEERKTHPARFALCEIVNVHDDALEFEPIHRVVFDINPKELINALCEYYPDTSETDNGGQPLRYITAGGSGTLYVKNSPYELPVGTLQSFLDDYTKKHGGKIDYIHGEDVTVRLGSKERNIGFLLPAMRKTDLFKGVIADGALPRKTFSMGEAFEKRFYLEAKKIR